MACTYVILKLSVLLSTQMMASYWQCWLQSKLPVLLVTAGVQSHALPTRGLVNSRIPPLTVVVCFGGYFENNYGFVGFWKLWLWCRPTYLHLWIYLLVAFQNLQKQCWNDRFDIQVEERDLELVSKFCYLGSYISFNESCKKDVKVHIGKAATVSGKMKKIWQNNYIGLEVGMLNFFF